MNISTIYRLSVVDTCSTDRFLLVFSIPASNTYYCVYTIRSINRFRASSPIVHHTSFNRCCKFVLMACGEPLRVAVSGYHRWSLSLRCAQSSSMGFKSGEFGGHFIKVKACSLHRFARISGVLTAVCGEALSC